MSKIKNIKHANKDIIAVHVYIVQVKRTPNKYSTYKDHHVSTDMEWAKIEYLKCKRNYSNLNPRMVCKRYTIDYNAPSDKALVKIDISTQP